MKWCSCKISSTNCGGVRRWENKPGGDCVSDHLTKSKMSRRTLLGSVVQTAIVSCAVSSEAAAQTQEEAPESALNGIAGIDRVTVLQGKTYLRGWAGYGNPPGAVR